MAWKRGRERVDSEGARVTRKSTMSTKRGAFFPTIASSEEREGEREKGGEMKKR